MERVGSRIDEDGMLVRQRGQLLFRRARGGRFNIEDGSKLGLSIEQPGRLVGTLVAEQTVTIERFTAEA